MNIYLRCRKFNPIPLYTLVEVNSENPAGRVRGYIANVEEYHKHDNDALYKIALDSEVVYELQRMQYLEKEDVTKHQMIVRSKLMGCYTAKDLTVIVDAKSVVEWQKEHGINIWERPSYGCNEMRVRQALDKQEKRRLDKQHFNSKGSTYLSMPRAFMKYSETEVADRPKIVEHPFDFEVSNNQMFWVNQEKDVELTGPDLLKALWSDVGVLDGLSKVWSDREILLTKRLPELREYLKTQMTLLFILWLNKIGGYACIKGSLHTESLQDYWLNFVDHKIDVAELDAEWLVCEPSNQAEDLFHVLRIG